MSAGVDVPIGYYAWPTHSARSTNAMTVNLLRLRPIRFRRAMHLDLAATEVTTVAATAVLRLGLYDAHPNNGLPVGPPLFDVTVLGSGVAGARTAALALTVQPRLYWLAAVQQTAAATWRTITSVHHDDDFPTPVAPVTLAGNLIAGLHATGSHTGALPTSPTIDSTTFPLHFPALGLRRAS